MGQIASGTTIVALKFKDGVIIAADKRTSAGYIMVWEETTKKIHQISDNILLGAAGSVGDIQFLVKILEAELKLKEIRSKQKPTAKEAANLLSTIMHANKWLPYFTEVIIVGKDNDSYSIYSIDEMGGISYHKRFIATGSGVMYALGVLESGWKENLSKEEAKELAKKAVLAAIQRDMGSGGGVDLYILTDKGIEFETYTVKKIIE